MQKNTAGLKEELAKKAGRREEGMEAPCPAPPQSKGAQQEWAIRLLRADEIECRVSSIYAHGLRLLLFKDARVDQKILDETFTPFGWKRTHQEVNGNLYCTVEVWDREKGEWVAKQDVGTASYSEKEKGQASDSFKRACFNWGIGRELYTAPSIWIPAALTHIKEDTARKGKYCTTDRFYVRSISYNGRREIASLTIVDQKGAEVFRVPKGRTEDRPQQTGSIQLELLKRELERTGISLGTVLERYGIQDIRQMTPDILEKALNGLRKTKTKGAA